MLRMFLVAPVLLLIGCGKSEAEKAAEAVDYRKIVASTCFLGGFGPESAKHEECMQIVGEATAAIQRRAEAAGDEARQFEIQLAFSQNMAESLREGRSRSCP